MNRLVVIGSDGFIGNSFVLRQTLFKDIIKISRFKTSQNCNEIICNNPALLNPSVFKEVEVVFNCIGVAHRKDLLNKDLFYKINRDLTLMIALKAKKMGVKKFVQMSSISVYGENNHINILSNESPTTHYGKSKAEADQGLLSMQDNNFKVLLLRPPMIYGKGAPGNMKKIIKLAHYLPVLPFSDAIEPRQFLCISNFCKIVEYLISKDYSGIALLKDTRTFSTKQLLEIIISEMGVKKRFIKIPFQKIIERLSSKYYQKLYSKLTIDDNLNLLNNTIINYIDPVIELKEMVKEYLNIKNR